MTIRAAGAVGLIVFGAITNVPIVLILGLFAAGLEGIHLIWARRGLTGVHYQRKLTAQRVGWGDEIEMLVEVRNRKRLPLAWLRAV